MSGNFNQLLELTKSQTAKFKTHFLGIVKENANFTFDNLPNKIKLCEDKIRGINEQIRNCCSEKRDNLGRLSFADLAIYSVKTRPMRKEKDKLEVTVRQCKKFLQMGKDAFVEATVDKASMMFDGKVHSLADKLDKKGFTPDCAFSDICNDPKLFDVIIASGDKKVHARSILAAVNSECMTAHFRFIITNVK